MTLQQEPQLQAETPVLQVRRHGRVLALPVLLLLVVAAASGYFVGNLPESWMNWSAGLAAIAIVLLLGVVPILAWLASRTTITTRRVIVRQGFIVHRRSEIPLSRVREVRSKRGVMQRLFGSGDVELVVGDAVTRVRDIPSPNSVINALQELIEHDYRSGAGAAQGFPPSQFGQTSLGQAQFGQAPLAASPFTASGRITQPDHGDTGTDFTVALPR